MRSLLTLTAILLSLLCACSAPSQRGPAVGFLLASMRAERYQKDREAFLSRVQYLGGTVKFESGSLEQSQQTEQATRMLGEIEVLVVQPVNSEQAAGLVNAAHAARVPVVAYDRLILNAPVDYYVTQDSLEVGRQQALYALKAIGGKGKVLICRGSSAHSVARQITDGNLEVLRKQPGIEVIGTPEHPEWEAAEARQSVGRALKEHPDLKAVLCNSSALAQGALQALAKAGLERKVYVAGADADLGNCRAILDGRQGMDVLKPIEPLAQQAADVAVALALGRSPEPDHTTFNGAAEIPTIVTPVEPFDRTNLEAVVIESGFHPRQAFDLPPMEE